MAYAYYEKIARINLTTGTVTVEKLSRPDMCGLIRFRAVSHRLPPRHLKTTVVPNIIKSSKQPQ